MSTFRQLDSVLVSDGWHHGRLTEVVIGARIAFGLDAVISTTTTSGLEITANRVFQRCVEYVGRITHDLGFREGKHRMIAVDIEHGGKASLDVRFCWQPGNEESRGRAMVQCDIAGKR